MSYYWFNRKELLKKAKQKYDNKGGKEKPGKYYKDNEDVLKKVRNKNKNLAEEEKELKRQYSKDRYHELKENF